MQLFTANPIVPRPKLSRDQLGHVYSQVTPSEVRASIEQQHFDRNRGRAEIASSKRGREGAAARLEGAQTFGIPSGCSAAQINVGVERLTPHPMYAIREEWEWFPAYGNGMRRHPMGNDQNSFYGSIYGRRIESNPLDTPRDVTLSGLLENQHPTQALSTEDLVNRFTMRQRAIDQTHEETAIDTHAEKMRQESLHAAQQHLERHNSRPVGSHDGIRQNPHLIPSGHKPITLHEFDTSGLLNFDTYYNPYKDAEPLNAYSDMDYVEFIRKDPVFARAREFLQIESDHPQLLHYYEDYQNRQFQIYDDHDSLGQRADYIDSIKTSFGNVMGEYKKNERSINTSSSSDAKKKRDLAKARAEMHRQAHDLGMNYFAAARTGQLQNQGFDIYDQPVFQGVTAAGAPSPPRRSSRIKKKTKTVL